MASQSQNGLPYADVFLAYPYPTQIARAYPAQMGLPYARWAYPTQIGLRYASALLTTCYVHI